MEFEKRRREDLFVESAVSDGESPFLLVLVDELVVGVSPQLVLRLKRRLFSSGPEERELDEDMCVCVWEDEGSLLLFLCDPSHGVASAATTARGSAPRSFGFNSMFPKELLYNCGILLFFLKKMKLKKLPWDFFIIVEEQVIGSMWEKRDIKNKCPCHATVIESKGSVRDFQDNC